MYADVFFRELITDIDTVHRFKRMKEKQPNIHKLINQYM